MMHSRRYGSELTCSQMRAHFAIGPKRRQLPTTGPARGEPESQARTPAGAADVCAWGCGAQLTGRNMRANFTICGKRPAASGDVDRRRGTLKVKRGRPPGPRVRMRLGLRRPAYGEPDAITFHGMPATAESLRAATGVARGAEARKALDVGSTRLGGNFCP
jgi:hypothetical protein